MADARFSGLSDEELADIWYALSGAEIRHTDAFKSLVDGSIHELEMRLPNTIRPFLDERFAKLRVVDAPEDVIATVKSNATFPGGQD